MGGAAGAVQGVGLRSNYQAVMQLMEEDLIGARRVAVVRDDFEQNQVALTPPPPSPPPYKACAASVCLQGLRANGCDWHASSSRQGGVHLPLRPGAQVKVC